MTTANLWTKNFVVISIINFLAVQVFYLLVVVVGLYATRDLEASVSQSGLIVGIFIVGALVGRLICGQHIDRIGRKLTMSVGLVLSLVACLLYYLDVSIATFTLIRFFHGIASGVVGTATATSVATLIPAPRRGEGIAIFSISTALATAIGPFIGMYLMQHTPFDVIVTFCSVLTAVCLFITALLLTVPEAELSPGEKHPGFSFSRLLEPTVVPICIVVMISCVSYSSVLSFLNMFSVEQGLVETASYFYVVYATTLLITRPFMGRLFDRRGANIVIYPALLVLGLGLMLLGSATTTAPLLCSAVLIGLGFGNMISCGQAMVSNWVAPNKLGLATSTFYIFVDAGLGFGPYVIGFFMPSLGYSDLYFWLGMLSIFNMVLYFCLHGRHSKQMRESAA